MKRFLVASAILLLCSTSRACGSGPTSIGWGGWYVLSNERLWTGRTHSSFPMTYLFDDNPRTAWVWSGQQANRPEHEVKEWKARYSLIVRPLQPIEIDEVRIMNGYNRSADLFRRNNRVVQMQIFINGAQGSTYGRESQLVKTANLKDSMGWHTVSLPRRKIQSLMFSFTGVRRGRDNDVCISGIELWNRGRKIDMKMPPAVHYDSGSIDDGHMGKPPYGYAVEGLVDWRRNISIAHNDDFDFGLRWSPSGHFVCGINSDPQEPDSEALWIADVQRAKVIRELQLPKVKNADFDDVRWLGHGKLALVYHKRTTSNRPGKPQQIIRTI